MPYSGDFLTDASGFTLYYTTADVRNESNAQTTAVADWTAFYTATIVVPPGLKKADFGTRTAPGGKPQTTYRGWPLYRFAHDSEPGDAAGQGRDGVWFMATPNLAPPALQPLLT